MSAHDQMSPAGPATTATFHDIAEAVDRAIAAVDRLDPAPREAAQQLRAALERFHKAGLAAIVSTLRADPRGKELLFDLVDVPEVRALLSLHGLIRTPGVPSVPGTSGTDRSPSMPPPPPTPIAAVIPLASLKARPQTGWTPGPLVTEVREDKPYRLDLRDTSVVLVRTGEAVQAFKNECAHQGLPIDGGVLDRESRTLTCPWHGFRFDCQTGECLTAPHVQLETVPVRVDGGRVLVQIG